MSKPNPQAGKPASVAIKRDKAQPFGAHFTTKLEGVNNKLVCALSIVRIPCDNTCTDDCS